MFKKRGKVMKREKIERNLLKKVTPEFVAISKEIDNEASLNRQSKR
jgi:hypothetical protein